MLCYVTTPTWITWSCNEFFLVPLIATTFTAPNQLQTTPAVAPMLRHRGQLAASGDKMWQTSQCYTPHCQPSGGGGAAGAAVAGTWSCLLTNHVQMDCGRKNGTKLWTSEVSGGQKEFQSTCWFNMDCTYAIQQSQCHDHPQRILRQAQVVVETPQAAGISRAALLALEQVEQCRWAFWPLLGWCHFQKRRNPSCWDFWSTYANLQWPTVFHSFFHIFSPSFWDPAALLGWTSASFQLPRRQHQLRAELPHQQLRRLPRLLPLMLSKIDRNLGPGEKGGDVWRWPPSCS